MKIRAGILSLIILTLTMTATAVLAQDDDDVIKVETQSVQTTLRVSNSKGKPVNVSKDDLRLFMDGKEQEISYFAVNQVKKFVVLLDASDSMKGRRFDRSIKFLEKLADNALDGQSFDVVTFDTVTRFIGTFTRKDKKSVFRQLEKMTPDGETALYQSVVETLAKFDRQAEPTALIVITDGGDNSSSPEIKLSAEKYLAQFGMMTYLIVLDTKMAYREPTLAPKDNLAKLAVKDFEKILQPIAYIIRYEIEFNELADRLPREAGFLARIGFDPDDLSGSSQTGLHQLEIVHRNEKLKLNYRRSFLTGSFLADKGVK